MLPPLARLFALMVFVADTEAHIVLSEEDLHTFDLRPLLSQNNPPDQITLLRF